MKSLTRRAAMRFALVLLGMTLSFRVAMAEGSVTVGSAGELIDALENAAAGYTAIVLGGSIATDQDIAIPSGKTVYVNGRTWNIGNGAVTGAVDISTPGSAILRGPAGSVNVPDDAAYVACELLLSGAEDG